MHTRFLLLPLALGACASPRSPGSEQPARIAIEWNQLVLAIAERKDGFLTLEGLRTAAMMHVAMHDALNGVERRYEPYVLRAGAPSAGPVDAMAVANEAAFAVVVAQYADRRDELAALRQRFWTDGAAAERGRALGAAAARAILECREGDGWNTEAAYTWQPMAPGVYAEFREHSGTPAGFVFGAGWAKAKPFLLERPDQFRSPPPPAIDSEDYARVFSEVKEVGRRQSATRTPDQTHMAMWWKDFVENSHNRLARDLVARERLDLWQAARMFALLNMSVYDAYVNVFDNKFHYNYWRPYTAIRRAAHDGNPDTAPEEDWDNTHGHTYAFPSYPSAHGCASAAAMTVLAETFGADTHFRMCTARVDRAGPMSGKVDMDPLYRSFDGFAAAAMECALSRVYLGIHFRADSVEGNRLGTEIARYGLERFLLPAQGR